MYLIILVVAWAVVLVPPIVQRLVANPPSRPRRDPLAALARRQQRGPASSPRSQAGAAPAVDSGGRDALVPSTPADAEQRRRLILAGLAVVSLVTLMLIPALGPVGIAVHLVADVLVIGFGYLWWRRNQAPDAATASVVAISSLRSTAPQPAPAMVTRDLPRVVNG